MARNPQSKQKSSDTSARITVIVAIIGLVGTLGTAYLSSRATLETKKQEIALGSTQLAFQANSTANAALTFMAIPTTTPNPTATTTSTQEVVLDSSSEIFIEDFSKSVQYWKLDTVTDDSKTSSRSNVNNALRWEVISNTAIALAMGPPTLPITTNIDMEATLRFVDGSESVEYGLTFRKGTSGSYRFLISPEYGTFYLGKYNGYGLEGKTETLIDWTTPTIPIHLNTENKLRVRAVGNNIRMYINDKLVGDVFDNSFSSGTVDILGNFQEGEKLTLDITNFKLTLVYP